MCEQDDNVVRDTNEQDLLKFKSSFNYEIHPDMSKADVDKLFRCLYDFRDVFAINDNADLGCTDMISHKIHLKPDLVPKHQRPYRLPPDKKAVLIHQLDELLRQGIIYPVSDSEDVHYCENNNNKNIISISMSIFNKLPCQTCKPWLEDEPY